MKPMLPPAVFVSLTSCCLLAGTLPALAQEREIPSSPIADPVRSIEVNGVTLAYVERGRGEAVVLIHGFLHDYRVWSGQVPELAKHFRTITYSMRHRWPNSPASGRPEVSVRTDAADLVALIRELRLGRVHLIGHSAGAGLALRVARDHPELVRSMVLGEPGPFSFAPDGAVAESSSPPEWVNAVREAYEKGEVDRALGVISDVVLGPDRPLPPVPWVRQMLIDNAWQLEELWSPGEPLPPITCAEARRIETPSLLLGGDSSPAFLGQLLDGLQACLPAGERVELPNSSHGLELENSSGFNERVVGFLKRHAGHAGS